MYCPSCGHLMMSTGYTCCIEYRCQPCWEEIRLAKAPCDEHCPYTEICDRGR